MENYAYNSSYPESGSSSPRSREIEFENSAAWEDQQSQNCNKVKFMCSYGGKVHPRPHDNQLSYIGGETKILSVDRNIKFAALLSKLAALCDSGDISFKYQLPGEELDALISVTNDDDLEHMMHEYDRLFRISPKPARLRVFVFSNQTPSLNSSARSLGSEEAKTEKERFVEALNSAPQPSVPAAAPQLQPPRNSVDFLFGFERANANQPVVERVHEFEDPAMIGSDPIQKHIQDLQRLRIEEQQGLYRRKSDDNLSVGSGGGDYNKQTEKIPQAPIPGGVPYWTEKQAPAGVYPASNISKEQQQQQQQQVYMIPAPANAYPAQMMRPATAPLNQGYYAVQRMPAEGYREQQQQQQPMYNMTQQGAVPPPVIQSMPQQQQQQQQKVGGYSQGYGMVRQGTAGGVGMVAEGGYAPVAYDGRQMVYSAPGGVMAQPPQYQGVATDMRAAAETGAKAAAKATQASV
ncbi:hypothetical protein SASPL_122315 [Salvia splendens]|uniref:PB1 domain-containing protein n=1 Tax=Salvia splendens TaxID=180675 RepID=A0A8X8XJ48_SALSN|nr:mediator of RNA polymerase II transcription subunit 12-like [Salvia splendens]KAG6414936.1 hypothetical protein SASPL_122315 [Salvia splendens]